MVFELPQDEQELHEVLVASENDRCTRLSGDEEPLTSDLSVVRCILSLHTDLIDHLLNIGHVSISYYQIPRTILTYIVDVASRRQSDHLPPPTPANEPCSV